jgi:hypothetical protein
MIKSIPHIRSSSIKVKYLEDPTGRSADIEIRNNPYWPSFNIHIYDDYTYMAIVTLRAIFINNNTTYADLRDFTNYVEGHCYTHAKITYSIIKLIRVINKISEYVRKAMN